MRKEEIIKKIRPLLDQSQTTVCLSTTSKEGQPESALVYYTMDEDLNFYFLTKELTQKSKNLEENHKVALLFFDAKNRQTLQIQGKAEQIKNQQEKMIAFDLMIKSIGENETQWPLPIGKIKMGNVCLYKITPNWMRLGKFYMEGKDVFEQLLG